jgi:glycosyltransferase involved in cell wall biosynthesis
MKIALVHDYLSQDGGAERVLRAFHDIWPSAPIFVLFYDKKKIADFTETDIHQSFISRLPFVKTKYQWYFPWMPLATERHNLSDFDVVLSSSSAFAKGVLTRPNTLHICYCHTPTRYLWTDAYEYISEMRRNRIVKLFLPRLIHHMRLWDKMSVDRVDFFIANSCNVQKRIEKYYRRESDIIYPPINFDLYKPASEIEDYFVTGGRLVPYKRFDIAVSAFNRLGFALKIFGDGPEMDNLKKHAKPNIEFLGRINEQEKANVLSRAKAFIHPQTEDLGITPIESMAAGRPVIAYGVGGVTETVVPGETGLFFNEQNWESLFDTVLNFDDKNWDVDKIRSRAEMFDEKQFKIKVNKYVEDRYEGFKRGLNQCRMTII